MITKTINEKEILFVQVPSDAEVFFLDEDDDLYARMPNHNVNHIPIKDNESNDNLYIIGLASDLTENEWKGIVEKEPQSEYDFPSVLIYKTYQGRMPYSTATQSGQSLLQSLNLNLETTLIIENK